MLLLLISSILTACGTHEETKETTSPQPEFERVLIAILTHDHMGGRHNAFDVFDPEMSFHGVLDNEGSQDWLKSKFSKNGYDFDTHIETLFSRNAHSTHMTIPSSPEDGYLIDYDGKFSSYLQNSKDGWRKLREENPKAGLMFEISVPAYDQDSGIILVYVGWQNEKNFGQGNVIAFKYQDGILKEIHRVLVWIA